MLTLSVSQLTKDVNNKISVLDRVFTPQPPQVGVLFSPMVSRLAVSRAGGQNEKVCLGCISETVRCRKLILGRDRVGFGWGCLGGVGVQCHGVTLTLPLTLL